MGDYAEILIEILVEPEYLKNKLPENFQCIAKKDVGNRGCYSLFGVKSGKLLGFVIRHKGIEVDPDKAKATQSMPSPKTEKEVRGFLGRLNYIARFIAQLTTTCEPICRLLRKKNPRTWNEECEEAFNKIKHYLQSPPLLVPPVSGRPLILYLTVTETAMGCVLGQHDETWRKERTKTAMGCVLGQHDETGRKERVIYYLSKKFTKCESRYTVIEKLCCALGWAAKRL
jgi:hypothetical protein